MLDQQASTTHAHLSLVVAPSLGCLPRRLGGGNLLFASDVCGYGDSFLYTHKQPARTGTNNSFSTQRNKTHTHA